MFEILNLPSSLGDLRESFAQNQPFPHIVLDDALPERLVSEAVNVFPAATDSVWYCYDNPLEKKQACHQVDQLPVPLQELIGRLSSDGFCHLLSGISGIKGLMGDRSFRGGGIHQTCRGGKLDIHLDFNRHPDLEAERRLNLILYLNRGWDTAWGGELELWNADGTRCRKRIAPLFNRMVLFSTGDTCFHGHPEPLNCPEGVTRKSVALYYFTPTPIDRETRLRVKFVPKPNDPDDPELARLRSLRANPSTAHEVYRQRKNGSSSVAE